MLSDNPTYSTLRKAAPLPVAPSVASLWREGDVDADNGNLGGIGISDLID
jgi:hypothetical protein